MPSRGGAMSIVASKGRKHLSADALFRLVQNGFASIPDARAEDTEISVTRCADVSVCHVFPQIAFPARL